MRESHARQPVAQRPTRRALLGQVARRREVWRPIAWPREVWCATARRWALNPTIVCFACPATTCQSLEKKKTRGRNKCNEGRMVSYSYLSVIMNVITKSKAHVRQGLTRARRAHRCFQPGRPARHARHQRPDARSLAERAHGRALSQRTGSAAIAASPCAISCTPAAYRLTSALYRPRVPSLPTSHGLCL